MYETLRIVQTLKDSLVQLGYVVGFRDGAMATAIVLMILYLITHRPHMHKTSAPAILILVALAAAIAFVPNRADTPKPAEPSVVAPEPTPLKLRRKPRAEAADDIFVKATDDECPFDPAITVTCDLHPELRHRNTVGIDGAGLCVFWSVTHAARYQHELELFNFATAMQKERGGGDPKKLDRMIAKYGPNTEYVQHVGGDPDFLKLALKTGRMAAITYCGVDHLPDRYNNNVIAHMVNCVYLDDKYGAILDNNFPHEILWTTAPTLISRWKGVDLQGKPFYARTPRGSIPIGGGWAAALIETAPPPPPRN